MSTNDHETKPSSTTQPAQPGATSQPSGSDRLRALAQEIFALLDSGAEPWKLRQKRRELDAERVRQIDRVLAEQWDPVWRRLLEEEQSCFERMQFYAEAMNRPDLTMPEMIFLWQWYRRNERRHQQYLMAEREFLPRRR